jgi:23S rRNA (uracil1939-C5)-methyltransferase
MVEGGLPGEILHAEPQRRRARIIEARTIDVLGDHHPARLEQPCPHSRSCGGCDWPHVDPRAGSDLKVLVAAEAAARFPKIEALIRQASVRSSPPSYRLRNRLHWDPKSNTLGFYEPRSWRVTEITDCRIISPTLSAIMPDLTRALIESCPLPVDVEVLEGADHVVAALLPSRGGPKHLPGEWVPTKQSCPGVAGFHRLDRASGLIPGWGAHTVRMDLPIGLDVPIGSFFQGNRHLISWLFERVADLVGPGDEPVYDLHGGVGFLAAAANWVGHCDLTVVEVHAGAAEAARRNLPQAVVLSTTAESFVADHSPLPLKAIVITDPPRSGMTKELRARLVTWRPKRIVMLGCDPATWSRDAAHLMEHGYVPTHIELVDLFPFTHHVEILAVMEPT